MPLQTPPRRSRLRGRRGSARALPAGNTEAERDQRGGGDGEQDRELLAEQLRPARGRKAGDGRERDARSRARHAAAAPTRPTVTSTATASVASASCANRRRPRFAVPNVAP